MTNEPTGAEWRSRENADGVTEWTLVRLDGATLPPECRPLITQCRDCLVTIDGQSWAHWTETLEPTMAACESMAAESMATRFRRLARRLK